MNVIILATKDCSHRPILENYLRKLKTQYSVRFFDDEPELIELYNIHLSPNVVVDEKVVFRATPDKRLPSESELQQYVEK